MFQYVKNIAIVLDTLLSVILGGWPDETLSARAYRLRELAVWAIVMRILDAIFFWDHAVIYGKHVRHCEWCFIYEQQRRDLPPEYRDL